MDGQLGCFKARRYPCLYLRCKSAFVLNDDYRGSILVAARIDAAIDGTDASGRIILFRRH
jgi:hypothetical protein